jgi:hypothetical protein
MLLPAPVCVLYGCSIRRAAPYKPQSLCAGQGTGASSAAGSVLQEGSGRTDVLGTDRPTQAVTVTEAGPSDPPIASLVQVPRRVLQPACASRPGRACVLGGPGPPPRPRQQLLHGQSNVYLGRPTVARTVGHGHTGEPWLLTGSDYTGHCTDGPDPALHPLRACVHFLHRLPFRTPRHSVCWCSLPGGPGPRDQPSFPTRSTLRSARCRAEAEPYKALTHRLA